jgi:hypothetical protein
VDRRRLNWTVFCVSAGVLGFEIALMRMLLVASWSHFAFLVISLVLLGFAASGTILTIARPWVVGRIERVLLGLVLLTVLAMLVCPQLARLLPVTARIAPATAWEQLAAWLGAWAVLTVPFVLGAGAVCLGLMAARDRIPTTYAANLLGSGAGALAAPVVMLAVEPAWLPVVMAGLVALGGLALRPGSRRARGAAWAALLVASGVSVWIAPPRLRLDPSKHAAMLERLAAQGEAERVARVTSPRGLVEAYRSKVLHDLPFLSGAEAPPPITALVIDGHSAGSVLEIDDPSGAAVTEQTLMAVPSALAPPDTRIALLGETGGANAWLAVRRGATVIDVVQPHRGVFDVLAGPLGGHGGAVLEQPGVRIVASEPRHFIERAHGAYDLIQLVMLESSAAGSGGIAGLAQDHTVTVEGVEACLAALADDGILFVCRGIQEPPRDNLKLVATFAEALRRRGADEPGRHVVIVRDFLGVCTMVRPTPWPPASIEGVRTLCRERGLTPVWYEGVRPEELNTPDALPVPPDGVGDWYHHAAARLLGADGQAFIDGWWFDIRPPTDDRPFFFDHARLGSLAAQRRAFGAMWLARTESAFLFVVAACAIVTLVGAVLVLLPLPLARGPGVEAGRWRIVGYFISIGLAYLLLELAFLSRVTLLLGDAVTAAAVTIAGFLLLSGAGSLTAQRLPVGDDRVVRRLLAGLVVAAIAMLLVLRPLSLAGGGLPVVARCAIALLVIAPVGFLMGFPMPLGLARLEHAAPAAIPWAWGINGCASVLASPLAMVLGMTWGFHVAGAVAVAIYAAAALTLPRCRGCEGRVSPTRRRAPRPR